jgi:hypothetical protein
MDGCGLSGVRIEWISKGPLSSQAAHIVKKVPVPVSILGEKSLFFLFKY